MIMDSACDSCLRQTAHMCAIVICLRTTSARALHST